MLSKNFLADLNPYRRCPHTADNAETLAWRRTTANQRARFIVTPAGACTARGDIIIRLAIGSIHPGNVTFGPAIDWLTMHTVYWIVDASNAMRGFFRCDIEAPVYDFCLVVIAVIILILFS